jgi:hypothetical protein
MRDLNLPDPEHPLSVLDHIFEWKLVLEVVSAGEMVANLVYRDRRKDRAVGEIGPNPLEFLL